MLKSFPSFRRNGTHLVEKKTFGKKRIVHFWGLSALNMQNKILFLASFKHVNFAINEKYIKKKKDNPNFYTSLVIF
jgi:hypothetical protein